jgi:uncharacterized protein YgiM (DUF1202 family)
MIAPTSTLTPTVTEAYSGAVWTPSVAAPDETICLRAQTDLYIRTHPSESSRVLSWLYEGNEIHVAALGADWTWVGQGYVRSKYLELCK